MPNSFLPCLSLAPLSSTFVEPSMFSTKVEDKGADSELLRHAEPSGNDHLGLQRDNAQRLTHSGDLENYNENEKSVTGETVIRLVSHTGNHPQDLRAVQRWNRQQVKKTKHQAQLAMRMHSIAGFVS